MIPAKILLIDDDPDDCYLFNDAVSGIEASCELTCVNTFLEALFYLTTQTPSLIFLDLNMPFKNGFECLAELKAGDPFKEIPVIIFSSSSYQKDIQMAYEKGAALYFTKPSCFDVLVEGLRDVLSKNWDEAATITASHFSDSKYTSFSVKNFNKAAISNL